MLRVVLLESKLLSKTLPALFTCVRFGTFVRHPMSIQIGFMGKSLFTLVTFVQFDSSVNNVVSRNLTQSAKTFPALAASMWLYSVVTILVDL